MYVAKPLRRLMVVALTKLMHWLVFNVELSYFIIARYLRITDRINQACRLSGEWGMGTSRQPSTKETSLQKLFS